MIKTTFEDQPLHIIHRENNQQAVFCKEDYNFLILKP